ncbi:hypothetical protein BASA83_004631 [Batrachochytrium salamandrivorans]|nr:hypothetical protein BASA83_004631 [Batrachochytrium salamandrivorans]
MVERMHATMGHAITTLTQGRPDRWDEYLQQTVFALRVRKHAVTKQSPFYLLYGTPPRLPGQHRTAAYHRSVAQAKAMQTRNNWDPNSEDYYYKKGDWVKLKHHSKTKFEFDWKDHTS